MCTSLASATATADVVMLSAAKDNMILGGTRVLNSAGAGSWMLAGFTGEVEERRALVQFGLTGIPPGSTINSASLRLVTSTPIADKTPPAAANYSLHRLTADWGEGASVPDEVNTGGGQGAPAAVGDATWLRTFFDTVSWSTQGGDFAPAASATTLVPGPNGPVTWTSAGMAADVQSWLDSGNNFGWILIGNDPSGGQARRFNTRNNADAASRPVLTVDFTPPAADPTIAVSPPDLFPRVLEGEDALDDEIQVGNAGGGTLDYTISAQTDSGGNWLSVGPGSGSTTGPANPHAVMYSTSALASDLYTGTIRVSDPAATNDPVDAGVLLTVSPRNDDCQLAPRVFAFRPPNGRGGVMEVDTFSQSTLAATPDSSDPVASCRDDSNSNSVWYRVLLATDLQLTVDTGGSDYDTVLSIWVDDGCGSLVNEVACDDDALDPQSRVQWNAQGGVAYLVKVGGVKSGEEGGQLEIRFEYLPEPSVGSLAFAVLATLTALRRKSAPHGARRHG